MYINCQKIKAFALFEDGTRPAEVFNELSLKKQSVYRYFQEWKRKKRIKEEATELAVIRQLIGKRIEDVEKAIGYSLTPERVAMWQREKRRAEELLKNPSLITAKERKFLLEWYSD